MGAYVNEPSNILLIAFKNHHYPPRSAHVGLAGWEWEFVSVLGRGGDVMLKVRLGHTRSATSINKFKLLFQIHHSHTNQCSCPA